MINLLRYAGFPKLAVILGRIFAPRWAREIWKAGDGRRIQIRDMDDAHLLNAIRYAAEGGRERHPKILPLRREAARRGLPSWGALPSWLERENARWGRAKSEWRRRERERWN